MRTPLVLICSALLAGLVVSTGCGGKSVAAVDGGAGGWDGPSPGNVPDGKMTGMGSDGSGDASGAIDGPFVDSLDAPLTGAGGADGGARDWVGADRAYLPAHSPDGSIPDCIWTLLRQCCGAPGDRCVETISDGGIYEAICWPTGERQSVDNNTYTVIGYASDGTVCFTDKPKPGTNANAFYDGAGQEVATYTSLNDGTLQINVTCDGATYRSTLPLGCSTVLGQRGKCLPGYCPL